MQKKFCHNCGKEITPVDKFCSSCGQQFSIQNHPKQPQQLKRKGKNMKSLISGLLFAFIVIGAFVFMLGVFTGELSVGDPTPSQTATQKATPKEVSSFKNRQGDVISVGSKCFTNGADKNCNPPATLMKLSLYDKSTLNRALGQFKLLCKIPHGTKVTILKIESFNGKATAQIKWGNKKGWMSINLLANKYQKPVGDRF